ncbi:MAG: 50S ribosomal protein L6, partial [bacterium]|nr:50S ribosomal protein L6 [bacterium]
MSRIGKEPVVLPAGVTATVDGQKVTVKGKLGELSYVMHSGITAEVKDGKVLVSCADDRQLG